MLRRLSYGPEAIDYLRCLLQEETSRLPQLVGADVQNCGLAFACVPKRAAAGRFYKFRTKLLWPWPDECRREVWDHLVKYVTAYVRQGEQRLVVSEACPDPEVPFEAVGIRYFRYPPGEMGAGLQSCSSCCCLWGREVTEAEVDHFLGYAYRTCLLLIDLTGQVDSQEPLCRDKEVPEHVLTLLAANTRELIVHVYDGQANMIWRRMPPGELARHYQSLARYVQSRAKAQVTRQTRRERPRFR